MILRAGESGGTAWSNRMRARIPIVIRHTSQSTRARTHSFNKNPSCFSGPGDASHPCFPASAEKHDRSIVNTRLLYKLEDSFNGSSNQCPVFRKRGMLDRGIMSCKAFRLNNMSTTYQILHPRSISPSLNRSRFRKIRRRSMLPGYIFHGANFIPASIAEYF